MGDLMSGCSPGLVITEPFAPLHRRSLAALYASLSQNKRPWLRRRQPERRARVGQNWPTLGATRPRPSANDACFQKIPCQTVFFA